MTERRFRSKPAFAACIARGLKPGEAARAIGVTRATVYNWKRDDPAFREMWDAARDELGDEAESQLFKAVRAGNIVAIMFACRHWRPEVYNRKMQVAIGGDAANPLTVDHRIDDSEPWVIMMPENHRDKPEEINGDDAASEMPSEEDRPRWRRVTL